MDFILASGSPRRRDLLRQIGLADFTVRPAQIDEVAEEGLSPDRVVMSLSRQKAEAVGRDFPDALILAADTVVAIDGAILGKPADEEDAARMLRTLSGRTHTVYTGFTVLSPQGAETRCEATEVTFRPLTEGEIAAYIASGEPMDKAGAYGIQALGALLVTSLKGDYFNVMGLPICRVAQVLKTFGLDLLQSPAKG